MRTPKGMTRRHLIGYPPFGPGSAPTVKVVPGGNVASTVAQLTAQVPTIPGGAVSPSIVWTHGWVVT